MALPQNTFYIQYKLVVDLLTDAGANSGKIMKATMIYTETIFLLFYRCLELCVSFLLSPIKIHSIRWGGGSGFLHYFIH